MLMRKLAALILSLGALCTAAIAQGDDSGDIKDCTEPGVLTSEGVKLGTPAVLLRARGTRSDLIEIIFGDRTGKTLIFEFGGRLNPNRFKVINKCRVDSGDIEALESRTLPTDGKEAKALTKFLTSWVKSLPEDLRRTLRWMLRAESRTWREEFGRLSEEDKEAYWICDILDRLEKPVNPSGK